MFQNIFFNIGKKVDREVEQDDGKPLPKSQMNHLMFLAEVAKSIQLQIAPINEELQLALTQNYNTITPAELKILHKSIEEIFSNINEIKNRSATADIIIQESLADSQKKRLINDALAPGSSMLILVRELMEAVDELEAQHAAKEFDHYRESAELLQTIQDRLTALDERGLGNTPAVSGSRARLAVITDTMCADIRHAYREIGPLVVGAATDDAEARPPIDKDPLSQADLTVDAIGPAFRTQLLQEIAQLQVLPYERDYRPGRPLGSLEQLEQRWDWFRRVLDTAADALVDVLPARWHCGRVMYKEFCRRSSRHLSALLLEVTQTPIVHDTKAHMEVVVKAVKSCLQFQTEMEGRLYAGLEVNSMGVVVTEEEVKVVVPRISDVFDEFLGPYVLIERRSMEEHMIRFEAEDDAVPTTSTSTSAATVAPLSPDGTASVTVGEPFESSRKMFEFVRASVKRCTAFSRGQALLALSDNLSAVIRQYAINLRNRCPAPLPAPMNSTHKGPTYVVSAQEELELCRVINTAEYCAEVLPQLETLIKSKIHAELAEKVTFAAQADAFMDAVVHATTVLVGGVMERLEPPLRLMRKTNWAGVTSVGDDSPYVGQIRGLLEVAVPRIRCILSGIHFKNWCLKMGTDLLTRFQDNVVKQKKIVPAGAEQLLLDVNGLKSVLLRMHQLGMGVGPSDAKPVIPPSFASVITAKAKQVETILKLVCTDEAILEERFHIMWPEGQPSDLQTILNLKRGVGLETVAQSMKDAVDMVGDHINDKVGTINLGNNELSDSLEEMAKGTLLGITSVGSSVGEGLTSTAKTAFSGFGKVGQGFESGIGKAGKGFETSFSKVGEGFGKVGEGFGKVGDTFKGFGGSALKGISLGVGGSSKKAPASTDERSTHSQSSDGSHA